MVAALPDHHQFRALTTPIAASQIHLPIDTDTLDACPDWA